MRLHLGPAGDLRRGVVDGAAFGEAGDEPGVAFLAGFESVSVATGVRGLGWGGGGDSREAGGEGELGVHGVCWGWLGVVMWV